MIPNSVIENCIEDLYNITKTNISAFDGQGKLIAGVGEKKTDPSHIEAFLASPADSQVISDDHLMKVSEDDETAYVIVTNGAGETAYNVGRIAVAQIKALQLAYQEKYDKNSFYQNLILDNMLLVDIYNRAKKLHIDTKVWRAVFLVDVKHDVKNIATELLKMAYHSQTGSVVTAVDESKIILIKTFDKKPETEDLEEIGETIVSLINTEAMTNAKVAFGNPVEELKDVSKSYKEGKLALEVSNIFYEEKSIAAYSALGIGRLIYQLPVNLCEMFLEEVFGEGLPPELDEETITMIGKFLENNLNVSQTSEQLYMHRHTILYRLDKVQKSTGLNLREFEDALTYRIAMMVQKYLDYLKQMPS
ncbi:MAG: helix-turn-helix domain-containing protein [Lachnospiraceae bacterium]|nr:helix-turn-helix domain-containing protein [Lachnospiraceae bacterium]